MARAILKTCKASLNGINADGTLPQRLRLFKWGVNESNQGRFIVDEHTAKVFENNQKASARETIPVDFNHNTVPGTEAYKAAAGSPAIAGYGKPVLIPGEGLFLNAVETTQSGVDKARDYKDLSPTPVVDPDTGRVIGLHSVALVPAGSVYDLTIEYAAENAPADIKMLAAMLATLSVPDSKIQKGGEPVPNAYKHGVDPTDEHMTEEQFSLLKKTMKMPEDCSFEDVMEKLKAHWEGDGGGGKVGERHGSITNEGNSRIIQYDKGESHMDKANAGVKMLEALMPQFKELLEAQLKPLSAELAQVKGQLDTERAKAESTTRATLIAQAGKDGKIIPLSAEQLADTKTFTNAVLEAMIGNIKPTVPMARTGIVPLSAEALKNLPKKTLSDSAAAINRSIGLAPNARFKDIGVNN